MNTTAITASHRYVGIDISAEYLQLTMRERLGQAALGFDT